MTSKFLISVRCSCGWEGYGEEEWPVYCPLCHECVYDPGADHGAWIDSPENIERLRKLDEKQEAERRRRGLPKKEPIF